MNITSGEYNFSDVLDHLKKLEDRIGRLEEYLHMPETSEESEAQEKKSSRRKIKNDLLEYNIGQFWFARIGILVLALGIMFFLVFPHGNLASYIPSAIGYILSAGMLYIAARCTDKYDYIRAYLNGGGIGLLYFATLRLHYFTLQPTVESLTVEITLLLLSSAAAFFVSVKNKSFYLSCLSLISVYLTALLSGGDYFIFIMFSLAAFASVVLRYRYNWSGMITVGIIVTYLSHALWLINNPFTGGTAGLNPVPWTNSFFLIVYAVIFSASALYKRDSSEEELNEIFNAIINSIFFYGLFLAGSLASKTIPFAAIHTFASVVLLILAMAYWVKIGSKYATFIYAMTGYLALSVAIIFNFKSPGFYVWLCWQSLLVVSTAIWFRSKFIIVANFFIYLMVFIMYLALEGSLNAVGLSYGVVALLSARILNWKKERLELKTEQMRNGYLLSALIIFPYALYHSVPKDFVGISWVIVALLYYLLSVMLKSKKYRWMAVATLLMTIGYVFIFGLGNLEATYRIVSFLVLGAVLLVISVIYAKIKTKKSADGETEED
jgi:uncharacterized membrane protein